ncbi:hypothetical protein KM043_002334 [Ampulex compressa]|nr:hypothetical protein KM043_002334 [Ampulex compressa]
MPKREANRISHAPRVLSGRSNQREIHPRFSPRISNVDEEVDSIDHVSNEDRARGNVRRYASRIVRRR